jgi:Holliday junction resolvase RusA-like endonuclease
MHTDPKTVAYEALISLQATLAMRGRPAIEGPVEVRIRAYYAIPKSASKGARILMREGFQTPANKKPDLDNVAKSVMDGCSKGVCFKDDTQVVTLTCTKRYCDNPRVEVSITKY